ncbi:ArsR/SmtB family transcription factor [Streptomyces mirabilis]|uniref:ArsR/SmtB family transcription factor n=1 Tax=Streptomyces mirabilis TaxID=68239 RepID=UPI0038152417
MKRIHFTAEDLARTRLVTTIGVAAETFDSVKRLKARDTSPAFHRWRVSVGGRLNGRVSPLTALIPIHGQPVDLMSLAGDTASIDEAVENLLAAPRALMRLELENIDFHPAHHSWARNLVDGDGEARLQVAAALRSCFSTAVAPYWSSVRSHLSKVRAAYAGTMADGGVEQLLTTLCGPSIRWRPPVLELVHTTGDADVHLNGRGLVIAPTMFSRQQIEFLQAPLDPARPPVLAVPTVSDASLDPALWERAGDSATQSVDDLLGRTRAAVLRATVRGCGTSELAGRLNISPASASYHATVLRNARLISTRREGQAVRHTVTSLGIAVLEQRYPLT